MDFLTALTTLLAKLKPQAYSNTPLAIAIDNNQCNLTFKELSKDLNSPDILGVCSECITLKTTFNRADFLAIFASEYRDDLINSEPLDFNNPVFKSTFANISINFYFLKKNFTNISCKAVTVIYDNDLQFGELWFEF